ncbi:MAG: hypothetical protein IPG74_17295 [Flavobacteriales bacterium]|nr:hypothetical protein [Flavobacteriales bacterium]MBK7555928.1 hypothetical protein [Flavobacteriales bacterium]MBK9195218.1 hypothetical protein [Flavobacteriales bacterium]MBP6575155.1 hypothetical protein [Flavobacteriales bacterium]
MKSAPLLLAGVLVFLCACTCKKPSTEAAAPPTPAPASSGAARYTGVLTAAHASHGCPYLVEADVEGAKVLLIPIGLDEKYLKDGTKLTFTYRLSRASSGECHEGQPAILEEVSVVP